MIKVKPQGNEPFWIDLRDGARIRVRPKTSALTLSVYSDCVGLEGQDREGELVMAMARRAIVEWEGIGDQDGEPLPVTPDAVTALLASDWQSFLAFAGAYAWQSPDAPDRDAEKNGSGTSPTGTSATAPNTADDVPTSI